MYQSPRDWPEIYRGVGRSCRRSPSTNIDSIGTARASQPWPSFLIAQLGPKARNKARKELALSRGEGNGLGRPPRRQTSIWSGIETVSALIFDFDGVIADSEAIANTVLIREPLLTSQG